MQTTKKSTQIRTVFYIRAYLFLTGGPVSWSSKCQSAVATSSTKAEYIRQYNAAREGVWIRSFLEELGYWNLIKEWNPYLEILQSTAEPSIWMLPTIGSDSRLNEKLWSSKTSHPETMEQTA